MLQENYWQRPWCRHINTLRRRQPKTRAALRAISRKMSSALDAPQRSMLGT